MQLSRCIQKRHFLRIALFSPAYSRVETVRSICCEFCKSQMCVVVLFDRTCTAKQNVSVRCILQQESKMRRGRGAIARAHGRGGCVHGLSIGAIDSWMRKDSTKTTYMMAQLDEASFQLFRKMSLFHISRRVVWINFASSEPVSLVHQPLKYLLALQ